MEIIVQSNQWLCQCTERALNGQLVLSPGRTVARHGALYRLWSEALNTVDPMKPPDRVSRSYVAAEAIGLRRR